jgi:exopolyphosphatase / guanosine-5'-triphosphate,3'-diphosphate pyrophosphatase
LIVAVIDIGTNTTRLLVAEVDGAGLRPLLQRRHFAALAKDGVEPLVELLGRETQVARRAGAEDLLVVGTAPLRRLPQARRISRACERAGAGELRILSEGEEADLAFLGATRCEPGELPETVAVADVGGGSTELVVGSAAEGPEWSASRPVGSRNLTERALLSDPPNADQLAAARNAAARRLAGLEPPQSELALAVGGGAASLRRVCGDRLDRPTIAATLERLLEGDSASVGERLGLAPERVRLLPAALVVLEAICELVPEPMRIARGGVREGLALQLAGRRQRSDREAR